MKKLLLIPILLTVSQIFAAQYTLPGGRSLKRNSGAGVDLINSDGSAVPMGDIDMKKKYYSIMRGDRSGALRVMEIDENDSDFPDNNYAFIAVTPINFDSKKNGVHIQVYRAQLNNQNPIMVYEDQVDAIIAKIQDALNNDKGEHRLNLAVDDNHNLFLKGAGNIIPLGINRKAGASSQG